MRKGITIVTLVITVIVLAVLTGAVMLTMIGDNGIFGETQTTIDKYNKQAMLEQIKLKIQKKRLAKVNEGQYSLKLEEDILPILETFGTYNESEMKLTTTEKNIDIYLYEIVNIPIKEIANVTYANEELTITEKVQLPNGYTFEYTKDNGITWSEYTSTTTIAEENGILIRLKNEEGKVVSSEYKVTSGVIEEIDSTKPIISIDTNGVTTGKTIKVTIIVTDEKGLDRNNTYEYCISTSSNDTTGATWIPYTNGISFTVGEGLTGGYYIHVKGVTDTAGNESGNKVSDMLTFDNTVPAVTIDIGRITDTSIEVLATSSDNSGQVKSTEYSIDNGQTWKSTNTFTNLTANTTYTLKVKSVDIFNNENIEEKQVTTNPRTWNGKIDISWYTKDPNKTTFDISTPNELAGLALLVDNEIAYYDDPHDANATSGTYSIAGSEFEGKTIVLNNDILINENVLNEDGTLNEANASSFVQWEPIGEPRYIVDPNDNAIKIEIERPKSFNGYFNGKGFSINGVYINKGIIFDQAVFASNIGIIENLHIDDSYISSSGGYDAGIVSHNEGVIKKCYNYSTVLSTGMGGGVVARNLGEVISCFNYGYVQGYAAGIVGSNEGILRLSCNYANLSSYAGVCVQNSIGALIDSCANFGTISYAPEYKATAGLVTTCYGTVWNSYNVGTIIGAGGDYANDGFYSKAGGITVNAFGDGCSIINCYNSGDVKNASALSGGFVCNVGASGLQFSSVCKILNCFNVGNVFHEAESISGCGGLIGNSYWGSCQMTNCYNLTDFVGGSNHGGLVGWIGKPTDNSQHVISNCYNVNNTLFGSSSEPANTTVTNTGLINADGTFPNGTPYPDLLTALNAWVNANKGTYPELKNWVMGRNGYPTFAE